VVMKNLVSLAGITRFPNWEVDCFYLLCPEQSSFRIVHITYYKPLFLLL
jgi:hypothetical protein